MRSSGRNPKLLLVRDNARAAAVRENAQHSLRLAEPDRQNARTKKARAFFFVLYALCGEAAIGPRVEHDFSAAILLVAEGLVHPWCFVDRHPMADHEARIDLAALNAIE